MERVDHAETVARRKLPGLPADWRIAKWQAIGEAGNAVLFTFMRVTTRVLRSGPNRGKERRTYHKPERTSVVTREETDAEEVRYERETGKCGNCAGNGQEWAGWSAANGHRYRECSKCGATGLALKDPAK